VSRSVGFAGLETVEHGIARRFGARFAASDVAHPDQGSSSGRAHPDLVGRFDDSGAVFEQCVAPRFLPLRMPPGTASTSRPARARIAR